MKTLVRAGETPELLPTGRMLLTVQEAADRLGVSRATLYTMFATGDLPYVQVRPRIRRVDPLDLQAYIARMKVHAREEYDHEPTRRQGDPIRHRATPHAGRGGGVDRRGGCPVPVM